MKNIKIKFELIDNDNKIIHIRCITVHMPEQLEIDDYINDVKRLVLEKVDTTNFDLIKIKRKDKSCEIFTRGEQKTIIDSRTILYKYAKGINPPYIQDVFDYEYIKENHECFDYNPIDRFLTQCDNRNNLYHNNPKKDSDINVNYMNKYLKYKNKYMRSSYLV